MSSEDAQAVPARGKDEVALELMKFIAVTTGYGKGAPATGYTGKPTKTAEEYAEALLQLFQRCRAILKQD
ncbi:MAG TPA: hypothetical protein VN428_12160 [Bryobacteraceae bacterium]|nr:hypothetical protein [Bryobacteraceae bacterium]